MFKHICSFPVGAVVGGILGGLAAVIIIAFSLLHFRKKRGARADHEIIDYDPNHTSLIHPYTDGQPSFAPHSTMTHVPLSHSGSADVVPAQQNVVSQTTADQHPGIVTLTESHGDDTAIAQRPAASPSGQGQQTVFVSSSYGSSTYEDARGAKPGARQGVGGTHSEMSALAGTHGFTPGDAVFTDQDAPPLYSE